MIYGYSNYEKWRLLIDGENFAVVQVPGSTWSDRTGKHYGTTSYHLVDKRTDPRGGHGCQYWKELKNGGRIGSKTKAAWEKIVEASDKSDAFAVPEPTEE